MVAATTRRVARHTSDEINRRIDCEIERNIRYFADHPGEIDRRLEELDRAWDVERVLQTNAAALTLVGTLMGLLGRRGWLVLPAAVSAFLLQHAVEGWCPPLPFVRRLGVRTAAELARERFALKALRGDFRPVEASRPGGRAAAAADAVIE